MFDLVVETLARSAPSTSHARHPDRRVVRVYRADGSESILDDRQAIDGESPLPGFTLPLAVLLDE